MKEKEDQKEKNDENTPFLDCIWQMEITPEKWPAKTTSVFFFFKNTTRLDA